MDKDILKYLTENCNYLKYNRCTAQSCIKKGNWPECVVLSIYNYIERLEADLVEESRNES